jgi:hypothetical protein
MDSSTRFELAAGAAMAADKKLREVMDRRNEFMEHFSILQKKVKASAPTITSAASARAPDNLLLEGRDICVCVRVRHLHDVQNNGH